MKRSASFFQEGVSAIMCHSINDRIFHFYTNGHDTGHIILRYLTSFFTFVLIRKQKLFFTFHKGRVLTFENSKNLRSILCHLTFWSLHAIPIHLNGFVA